MAKNFYGLKDGYQATYILENVIQNFTDFQMWLPMLKRTGQLNGRIKTNSSIKWDVWDYIKNK
jgi:hypothetical protein